jgi:hypothetical protein
MNSYWLSPEGRLIESPMTHAGHVRAMKVPAVPGYAGTDGSAGAQVQTLLNMGFVRVQAAGKQIGFDAAAELTPTQRGIIRAATADKEFWAGQVNDQKGRMVHWFSTNDGGIHRYLTATSPE